MEISLYSKNNYVLIDVKDSGSGMTNTQMRSAFKGLFTKKAGVLVLSLQNASSMNNITMATSK